jgi:hypothetical protein
MPSFSTLHDRRFSKRLFRLLALMLALALSTPVVLAQDWVHDHLNGPNKFHDPTGAWFIRTTQRFPLPTSPAAFVLLVFHQGGTLTQDTQGEAAFDPSAVSVPPSDPNYGNNVITSPQSGVWQKTGWNTFAATLMNIQYHVSTNPEPGSPVFVFATVQYVGRLTGSGDTLEYSALETHFDVNGNRIDSGSFNANGVRIPLLVLPNTPSHLTIPPLPPNPPVPNP